MDLIHEESFYASTQADGNVGVIHYPSGFKTMTTVDWLNDAEPQQRPLLAPPAEV